MPRLKKHSKIVPIAPSLESRQSEGEEQIKIQENNFSNSLLKPVKMKFSQRLKLFQEGSSTSVTQPKNNATKSNEQGHNSQEATDNMNCFLNKYTDDDDESWNQKSLHVKTKVAKQKKPDIKTHNKFFSDVQFQEKQQNEGQQLVYQQLELKVQKKQKRESFATLQKFEQRASIFKKKLQYKDLNKDHKYKKNLQEKLKSLDQIQEVKIVVEIPKIFGGKNSHLEAAFFLKNNKEEATQQLAANKSQPEPQEQTSVILDRKQYYEELGKQVKIKKAESLTENILKECFRKSKLDYQDYLPDFDNDKNPYQDSQLSRPNISKTLPVTLQEQTKTCLSKENKSQTDKLKTNQTKAQLTQIICIKQKQVKEQTDQNQNEEQKENTNQNNMKQSNSQILLIEKNLRKKTKQNRKKRQIIDKKNFKYKSYLQEQAQVSDDENGGPPGNKQQNQTDEDDDNSIDSLIDDDVNVDSNDRYKVHNKFVADMIADEERKYQQMRQKLQKKYLQEQEDLKKRMEEAARKRKEKEDKQQSEMLKLDQTNGGESNSISRSNDTATKLKNEQKIKQLQEMLKGENKQLNRKNNAYSIQENKLRQLQTTIIGGNNAAFKRAPRDGFKNVMKKPIKANNRKSK